MDNDITKFAKGQYQLHVLLGYQAISGADLRGKARQYGARYKRSRRHLLARLQDNGVPVCVVRARNGKLNMMTEEEASTALATLPSIGEYLDVPLLQEV